MPQTIEQLLETAADPNAHSVQIFSLLLYLFTLGSREHDALNNEEIADALETWFSKLLNDDGLVRDKLTSQQTIMVFFSCFAFGPLVLVAPQSLQVLGNAYEQVVNQVEEIVSQQDSRSFDNVMILTLSLLKSISLGIYIEKTGDFVSKKKVAPFEADTRSDPGLQEVHPRLLHDERGRRGDQHRGISLLAEGEGESDRQQRDQHRLRQAELPLVLGRRQQEHQEHAHLRPEDSPRLPPRRQVRPRQPVRHRVVQPDRRELLPEIHRNLHEIKRLRDSGDQEFAELYEERELYSRIIAAYTSSRLFLDASRKPTKVYGLDPLDSSLFGVANLNHFRKVHNDTVEKLIQVLFLPQDKVLFAPQIGDSGSPSERAREIEALIPRVTANLLLRLIALVKRNEDPALQYAQM